MSRLTQQAESPADNKGTYGQILKSSAWIGGSSLASIAIGIARIKVIALLLNPAGFSLFGIYGSISSLAQCAAGMGLNSSGVRQIAHAISTDDAERIGRAAAVLRITSILLGALGAAIIAVFSRRISILTFGTAQHSGAILLLSIAVFLHLVSNYQSALIQGMRRVRDLSKMRGLASAFGAAASIPLVYFLRENGVVPAMVAVAATALALSWWYSRRLEIAVPSMTVCQIRSEASALLKLGVVFMSNYVMAAATAYAIRVFLLHRIGLAAAGYYQSAWTMGGLYVGLILESMGADFYPRLTACAEDDAACNRLVNEQTQMGLLLAGPGVIATLTFAPVVIALFYSTKFAAAVGILRWICLGAVLQVITWPMSYMIVAKARRALYFGTECFLRLCSISLAWVCIRALGLNGAGIAFFAANVLYAILLVPVLRHLSGFEWSAANKRLGLLVLSSVAIVFLALCRLPLFWAACVAGSILVLSTVYSLRCMVRLVNWERIPLPVRRLLAGLRLAASHQTCIG